MRDLKAENVSEVTEQNKVLETKFNATNRKTEHSLTKTRIGRRSTAYIETKSFTEKRTVH
jgi:hypothetical protein